ncbi:MAG: hypothetical protein HYR60_32270, partial [Acidobacteria bacterium]|nr:hypothetical protein [Acidobacteriota bacterium]
FCALWAKGRDKALGAIVAEKGYVAAKPAEVRVLSALKAGRPDLAGENAAAIPHLAAALKDRETEIAHAAEAAARVLSRQEAIDAFCALWAKGRDNALGAIVAERAYVAAEPVDIRVLSALKAGARAGLVENPAALDVVIQSLGDSDADVARAADEVLRATEDRRLADRLCAIASHDPSGRMARICVESGKRPSDPEQRALYLFITRQLDAYFEDDHDFENLWTAFDRAPQDQKDLVLDVARSGGRGAAAFFGRRKKPLTECNEREIKHGIEVALQHGNWPELFKMFTQMPLRYAFPLIEKFRASQWAPEADDQRALLRSILREVGGETAEEVQEDTSAVFQRWLADGRTLAKESESDLLNRLQEAAPPDGVAIVAALAAKNDTTPEAKSAVEGHAHWLVRLAGYSAGLLPDWSRAKEDTVYWVRELAGIGPVLDLWPVKATPSDLKRLDAAPREAFAGKPGEMRRVLRLLIAHRMTLVDVEEVVIAAGADATEVEDAE